MSFFVKINYSPMGNSWNLFSAGAFDGSSDPGVPQAEDGDNDLPPIESFDGGENLTEMNSNEGVDQVIGNSPAEDDSSSAFSGGNDRRTK
jgi:hypothetical protein